MSECRAPTLEAQKMNLQLCRLAMVCALLSLGACVVYEPVPLSAQPTPEALADGRLQVKFASKGADGTDLTQRVSDSYDRRMGR